MNDCFPGASLGRVEGGDGVVEGGDDADVGLLQILRKHAVAPRVTLVESVLSQLQDRRAVSDDIDKHTIATMCFGSYFAAFYRGDNKKKIPETVVAVPSPVEWLRALLRHRQPPGKERVALTHRCGW